ncbi:SAM-dependent methyltransferase [Clostridium butyricum]|uniref:Cyclopropane-fatty-acyl-phospholipid synthase n=1 Tax=Clostridium butyricum E4 str. BoNT E BL5262 TaxID=632245 RepID=C4ICH4_CLOBU|nr:cyclopropane-fatty-acyl-phospholipid synthase family protein [Clostridium butyricum]EDT76247.1 cyclopropane-fatty-acyl-phospholipid synthase [Clostridium butyricum 5521]EEP56064.1 cyclopropane-fatty-acyl-phospholipid synthase [Clostridium butyricum E4 str. BoNT E BL5262]NFL33195.1 class I SAM-dependent methyltransferase [Clostridium butyricum]NFS16686.1 class I SAM-dependent methyltransferase [Clostridium butyricum]
MLGDKVFYKTLFKNLFSETFELQLWDGSSEIYGDGIPKFKIIFNEPIPKSDIINDPSIAFGEGYMTKKFDIHGNIEEVVEALYDNKESFLGSTSKFSHLIKVVKNNLKNSKENIEFHYDIGNDFYKLWLDDTMTYSCGYFKSQEYSLTEAQKNKVNHILKKLNLQDGETLLDIGCGWGELIITAAKMYKVKATGITLSTQQFEKVKERIESEGLNDLVDVKLIDYRELKDIKFDKIVSVGMLEHVGKEHLCEYFSAVNKLLNKEGLSLLHCITNTSDDGVNSWINKYIFPGGYVPSIQELISNMSDLDFNIIDVENLRLHYAKTLECWYDNFQQALPEIEKNKDETFIRMWELYLNSCAASFKSGNINLHQFLFSKGVNNNLPWTREYMYKL